jgi:ATP-dependent Clp protease ATP-binding subunit ClpB
MRTAQRVPLDPSIRCADAIEFEDRIRRRVIGQEEAVRQVTLMVQKYMAGLSASGRPISNLLFLGPSGSGKTRLVEALAAALTGDENKFIKINCGEFQESHATAKLTGSPPGYVGHNDTKPAITKQKIEECYTESDKLAIILFDEIEKAAPAFWDLLLGILDKAKLVLSSGEIVDFSRCMIIMTSNLGSKEVASAVQGGMGFKSASAQSDRAVESISKGAARKQFRTEFFGRLDHIITFKALTAVELRRVLALELGMVQKRILSATNHQQFVFHCSPAVEDFLIREGTDSRYGARHLRRVVEKQIVEPLSSLIMSGQVEMGDIVQIELRGGHLKFDKIPAEVVAALPESEWADFRPPD